MRSEASGGLLLVDLSARMVEYNVDKRHIDSSVRW